jgi:hypothetical protein
LAFDACCSHNAPRAEPSAAATTESPVCCTAAGGSSTAGGTFPGVPNPEDGLAAPTAAPAVALTAVCAAACFRAPAPRRHHPMTRQHAAVSAFPPRAGARVFNSAPSCASSPPTRAPSAGPSSWAATSTRCRVASPPRILDARSFAAAEAAPASDANGAPGESRPEPLAAAYCFQRQLLA